MFRAIILPIIRSTRQCVTACGIMHPRCCWPVAWKLRFQAPALQWVHYTTSCNTQSSPPEDGQNNCPKHVELIGIINKPLLLHLVGCLHYLYQWCTVKQILHFLVILFVELCFIEMCSKLVLLYRLQIKSAVYLWACLLQKVCCLKEVWMVIP